MPYITDNFIELPSTAHIGESKAFAEKLVESEGLTYINGYDDPPIVAGAGTMGIEIIDEVPCVDAVVVPVGGAGKMINRIYVRFCDLFIF